MKVRGNGGLVVCWRLMALGVVSPWFPRSTGVQFGEIASSHSCGFLLVKTDVLVMSGQKDMAAERLGLCKMLWDADIKVCYPA